MFVAPPTAHEVENARIALVLIAVGIAVFWRTALRVLIALVIVVICAGIFVLAQDAHL